MKKSDAKSLRAFAIELAIYAVLVTIYFFLVLHLLGNWLYRLETQHRVLYAVVAILLIVGQAVVLDAITTVLFRVLRRRWR
jgi:Na+-driven multidrug efflux pump